MNTASHTVLVTGGTGTLGRLVVPRLVEAGCHVRILSRTARPATAGVEYVVGDLESGAGVEAAVAGVETVLHLAGSQKHDDLKARTLVEAASKAKVRHLVYISVVGADRVPIQSGLDRMMFGYFGSKRAAELIVQNSGIPWTTLRATQFHELNLLAVSALAKLPIAPIPAGIRFQPIDADEVAERLAELTLGEPAGLVPELAGPRVYGMDELFQSYLASTGRKRPMLKMRLLGGAARAMRDGANLDLDRAVGIRTWEQFLASQPLARQEAH